MRKISFSLIISILIIVVTFPVFANETIIPDNPLGVEVEEINYPEKMVNNNGTVKKVNDSGHVENNNGNVINLSGSIYNNYGTIDSINDRGSVIINEGNINKNNYYINVNNASGIIKENNYRVQANQHGIIETNNSEVWVNFGSINVNNEKGVIDDNFGIVTSNSGTIQKNSYDTSNTITNSVTNTEKGKVIENNAKVSGGNIEKNYSKAVDNTTIEYNYSNEVGENVTIKRNFANFINNANIENQYYKLTVRGNIDFVCKIDTNSNVEDNIYIDQDGQTWIRAEDAMFEIKAKRGFKIVGAPMITAGGTTIVSKEDARNISFSNISGEIIVEVETEEIETFKVVFNANGGKFIDGTEVLTYEKWIPEDYRTLGKPTRDGYTFLGYFTEIDGGTSFDNYYNEAGVDKDMTLYAHWEDNSITGGYGQTEGEPSIGQDAGQVIPETQTGTFAESPKTNNPQTGNSITIWLLTLLIACVGLIVTRKNKKI